MDQGHDGRNPRYRPCVGKSDGQEDAPSTLGRVASDLFALAASKTNSRHVKKLESIGQALDAANKVIDDEKFEAVLDKSLPRPSKDGTVVRKRLRDAQFRQLAEFCNRAGRPQLGFRPRTFALLRMIGCPEAIEAFAKEKLTDISLPYSEENLPSFISGQARGRFLDCQNHVLNGRAAALERSGEPHQHVDGSADDYFVYVEDLGAGGFGEVDSVIGELSLKAFARKRIKRHRLYSKDKARLQVFENELQTLKLLSHRHLVQLVGSYTDSSCVGLIMVPVADMNLAAYLKRSMNEESRKICLRRFFGCLANALLYLHDKHVQHKDIKPENILVKNQQVYLTDFGTSKSWDSGTSKTTQGTVFAFTPRYCAPEVVQYGSSRNELRDIWSLGCVFLEMCCVLANHSVENMWEFFRQNGSGGEYVRENSLGAAAWVERLKLDMTMPQDQQPLELSHRMCTVDARKRPSAKELVAMIYDFESPPRYYGLCCDDQTQSSGLDSLPNAEPTPEEAHLEGIVRKANDTSEEQTVRPLGYAYQPPTAEDPTEEVTIQAFFHAGGIARRFVLEDAEEPDGGVDAVASGENFVIPTQSVPDPLAARSPLEASRNPESRRRASSCCSSKHQNSTNIPSHRNTVLSILQSLDQSRLPCPWPTCNGELRWQDRNDLLAHLRDIHGTHELFWAPLLGKDIQLPTAGRTEWKPGQIVSELPAPEVLSLDQAFILRRGAISHRNMDDPYSNRLKAQVEETKKRLATRKTSSSQIAIAKIASPSAHKDGIRMSPRNGAKDGAALFCLLPENRRPEPLDSKLKEERIAAEDEPVLKPDPLLEPFTSVKPRLDVTSSEFHIPKSSLAPYFLATTNCFSSDKLRSLLLPRQPLRAVPPPLFVYGSLMFPSVLRAQAAYFMSAEGIYSKRLQRRLQTSAVDWSGVNESLQRAAEQMTPALLGSFERFKIPKFIEAAVAKTTDIEETTFRSDAESSTLRNPSTKLASEVKGFLVFGLSYEALECIDHFLSPGGRKTAYRRMVQDQKVRNGLKDEGPRRTSSGSDDEYDPYNDYFLRRNEVQVTVCTSEGKYERVLASTHVWQRRLRLLVDPWDTNMFLRSSSFRKLSTVTTAANCSWLEEEKRLAAKMGMLYAMHGDELCDSLLRDDFDSVENLIANGHDINAPCHNYGTPLQAAVIKGNEEMVHFLVHELRANPNKTGGRYHLPLVAAISEGHEDIVRTLLKGGAHPFAEAASYVSPIYQAVDFEDTEMTHLLLEYGAWLTPDYEELLDLAAERCNNEIGNLLKEYDIHNLHKKRQLKESGKLNRGSSGEHIPNGGEEQNRSICARKRNILEVVVQVMRIQGQKGKWTGMKGINVLRLIYQDSVPENIVESLRSNLQDVRYVIKSLSQEYKGGREIEYHEEALQGKTIMEDKMSDEDARPLAKSYIQHHRKYLDSGTRPKEARASKPEHKEGSDVFCLSCGGRGGRKGTGHLCSACHGQGYVGKSGKRNDFDKQRMTECDNCEGRGTVFSERDRCRVCNGSGQGI